MITLGLDPSFTGFGWAIHNSRVVGPGRVVAKGVITTTARQVTVGRYLYFREAVRNILATYPEVENVGAESSAFGETWSEGAYALFIYVTEAIYLSRKDIVFFDPSRVKMLVRMDSSIRRGTIDKQDVIDAARADSTVKKWNHNEADAYIVARSAARFWEYLDGQLLEDELTPSEANAFLGRVVKKTGLRSGDGLTSKEGERFYRFSKLTAADVVVPVHPIVREG